MSVVPPLLVFRDAALRSGLVTPAQWQQAVAAVGEEPSQIAAHLVQQAVLTAYQAQQLQAGRGKLTLGPYLITDWIAQGGMGQVFKAVHTVMGRPCAVKVLPLEKSTPESRKSFLREIRLQAELDCPYLVRAFDAGHDGNVHYLVTEYVPGTDLRRMVRQGGRLNMHQAAGIIRQAALGLHYAHGIGLIHRDVKPGNILVTPAGRAKVSDVGLATWSLAPGDDPRAGKLVGTADYLSPEQIRSPLTIHPASDIYSLGCTLYYAVTGKVPYPGGDSRSKCRRHLEETPWHPRRFASSLDEEFVELIAEMMEKDPQRRIASASQVAQRLLPWCTAAGSEHGAAGEHGDADSAVAGTNGVAGVVGSATSVSSAGPWRAAPPPAETAGQAQAETARADDASPANGVLERLTGGAGVANGPGSTSGSGSTSGTAVAGAAATALSPPAASAVAPATAADSLAAPPAATTEQTAASEQAAAAPAGGAPPGSRALLVAWVLAIAVPISLLVGAILGFLVRSRM